MTCIIEHDINNMLDREEEDAMEYELKCKMYEEALDCLKSGLEYSSDNVYLDPQGVYDDIGDELGYGHLNNLIFEAMVGKPEKLHNLYLEYADKLCEKMILKG